MIFGSHNVRFLTALCATVLAGCDSRQAFTFWSDRDYFLDGNEFSVTVERESRVQVTGWMEHGSGYRAQVQCDYWRVVWNTTELKEGCENMPTRVDYLGRFEERRTRNTSTPVHQKGVSLEMADFTGSNHVLVWKDGRYLSPQIPLTEPLAVHGSRPDDGKHSTVLTSSRRHMLLWGTPLAICDSANLKVVREIKKTVAVSKLRTFHDTAFGIHRTSLTNDLRYLVIIPHNGNESPVGHNHHVAWCYDILEDRFFEKRFGDDDRVTAVMWAESWDGRLCFLVDRDLLDVEGGYIGRIPSSYPLTWVPSLKSVWMADGKIDSRQHPRTLVLTKHDYVRDISTQYLLNSGELNVP